MGKKLVSTFHIVYYYFTKYHAQLGFDNDFPYFCNIVLREVIVKYFVGASLEYQSPLINIRLNGLLKFAIVISVLHSSLIIWFKFKQILFFITGTGIFLNLTYG